MATKKTFVLRIHDSTYEAIVKWAADDFRSINGQLEWIIDNAIKAAGRDKKNLAVVKKKAGSKK